MDEGSELAGVRIHGDGAQMRLSIKDGVYTIWVESVELMSSSIHKSEDELAKIVCGKLKHLPQARILIGGLGMGYTLAAALKELGPKGQVVVAELMPAVLEWNRGVRLTAFSDRGDAQTHGIAPSLAALPFLPESGTILDIGSGGGFPAIPLALARPALRITCCEPAERKAAFLRLVGRELGLGLTVAEATAEAFLRGKAPAFDAVTVRGVRLKRPLVRLLRGAILPGGALLVWTGGETLKAYHKLFQSVGFTRLTEIPLSEGSTLLAGIVPRGTPEG